MSPIYFSASFVTYQLWSLQWKLRAVNDVHRTEKKVRFIYPSEPLLQIDENVCKCNGRHTDMNVTLYF